MLSLDTSETGIRQALEDGPYGRCVYACDNDFLTDETQKIEHTAEGEATNATGHAGDAAILLNFIRAVAEDEPNLLVSDPEVSFESHLVAFAAERARNKNSVVEITRP